MTFVNASLLAGTALVALPIVLHLIMRRKPKLLEFPALLFVQKRRDTNVRKLRLRHLILLLLRAAAIALLAFALARPSVKFGSMLGSQQAPVAAAVIVDTAPRMEYRHGNETRLQAAKKMGNWLLAQLPPDSKIAVIDTGPRSPNDFQADRLAAKQQLNRLGPISDAQPVTRAVEKALRRLADSNDIDRKEVYIFTDLTERAWPGEDAATFQARIGEVPGVGIYVIDVGVEDPTDFALGELRLSEQVLSSRSPLEIQAELRRIGPKDSRVVELFLIDEDGNKQKRYEESYELADDETKPIDFLIGSLGVGTHQGIVQITGSDALEADDVRYFTVEVQPAWRILIAAPKPAQRYALFLVQALAPAEFRKRGRARFDCKVVDLNQLPNEPLSDFAAVCVLDPAPLEPVVWQRLGDYAATGGGVAVFLGRNATKVISFNTPEAQELLPGKLLRQIRCPDGNTFLTLEDSQHAVLSLFRRVPGTVPWSDFPVFRYWQLENPTGTILRYNNGAPALLEKPVGAGRVLTMTTPVSDAPTLIAGDSPRETWNLLPVGEAWPFGMLMHQMMFYLAGNSEQRLNYFAGQTATLPIGGKNPHKEYLITTPDGLKFPQPADTDRRELVIASTDQVGNYRAEAGGTESKVERGFSVNMAPRQTDLTRIEPDRLKDTFGLPDDCVARTKEALEVGVSSGRVGRKLFGPLILMMVIILALEHCVANRFYRE